MKEQRSTRHLYILLTVWVIAVAALTLTACGQPKNTTPHTPAKTTTGEMCRLVQAPTVTIHYRDEDYLSSVALTPSHYTYIHGAKLPAGTRPCEQEQLCTVTMANTDGEVQMAFFAAGAGSPAADDAALDAARTLTDLTLTAYPATEDGTVDLTPEKAQAIPVTNGRFTLLVGRYYYELTLSQDGGQMVFGFIAHRIDAEEYKVTEHVSGCIVEVEYEDPDHMVKNLFYDSITLYRPSGREGNSKSGRTLFPCGKIRHTYTNYAGTEITRHTDLGEPIAQEGLRPILYTELDIDYEIEWPRNHKVTAAHYERYTHDGTLVDGKALIAADITGTNIVHLEPYYYYVFTVYYEDLSAQYVMKTGAGVDEIASHPKDDPNIDPALAKYLRAAHMQYFHTSLDSLDTVDLYIYRYLGRFGDMEAVVFEEPDRVCKYTYSTEAVIVGGQPLIIPEGRQLYFYHTHRFYTPEKAYKNGWITDADITTIAEMFPETLPRHQIASEGEPLLLLTRPLPGTQAAREIRLTPLGDKKIDLSLGKQLYGTPGIYTVKFVESPAEYEVLCDPTLDAKHFFITRYPLLDPAHSENLLLQNGKMTLEAGYYYEIEVLCATESVRYGIVTAFGRMTATSPTNPRDVVIHYTERDEEKQAVITRSLSSTSWTTWGEVTQTAAAVPHQLPGLCEITATEAQVTLREGMEIAAYVITATPVDENNKLIHGSDTKTSFTVVDDTFDLFEGSYYYEVYVCFNGSSYTRYGFIAHYMPNETGGNS